MSVKYLILPSSLASLCWSYSCRNSSSCSSVQICLVLDALKIKIHIYNRQSEQFLFSRVYYDYVDSWSTVILFVTFLNFWYKGNNKRIKGSTVWVLCSKSAEVWLHIYKLIYDHKLGLYNSHTFQTGTIGIENMELTMIFYSSEEFILNFQSLEVCVSLPRHTTSKWLKIYEISEI